MKMMYYILIITIFLTACSNGETNVQEKLAVTELDTLIENETLHNDTIIGSPKDKTAKFIDHKEFYSCFKNFINPTTFLTQTKVYIKPDSMSEIIESLKFNTRINLTEDNGKRCDWYEIQIGSKIGYVMADQIATHSFNSVGKNKNLKYFIVTDFNNQKTNADIESYIYKYDLNKERFIDTFEVMNFGANVIRQVNSEKWKNVDILLFFDNQHGCCGCTLEQNYLIDANNKFETIFTTSTFLDDGGEGYEKWVNVTLAQDPTMDTIYYQEYEYGGLYKNDEPVLDKKGNQKNGVISDVRKYYKWDGFKLIELKN